jgi:cephalosporin hydroxylase
MMAEVPGPLHGMLNIESVSGGSTKETETDPRQSECDVQETIDAFHDLYYNGRPGEGHIFQRTTWMGVPCLKCPLDLWIYQEILYEIRPDLIIETGTHLGGSALYLAHVLDILGKGEIVTIDINDSPRPQHPRVHYVQGSSANPDLVATAVHGRRREVCMVILDSDHSEAHVTAELEILAPYVTPDSYLIVEDTNINGHPTYPSFGPGPFEALQQFLPQHPEFIVDPSREKFLMTFNPRGFVRRLR